MLELRTLVNATTELVALPDVYLRVREKLSEPDYSIAELATIVSSDPALTVNLLRLANSAFFGFAGRVPTVGRAISLFGSRQLHDLLLATSVSTAFSGLSSNVVDRFEFWRGSVLTASVARLLARRCSLLDSEGVFVRGLLHDVGQMVLYLRAPEAALAADRVAVETSRPRHLVQRELLGLDYARVGSALLERWRLPPELVTVVRHHPEPDEAPFCQVECAVVHLSAALAAALIANTDLDPGLVSPAVWRLSGADPDWLSGIAVQAELQAADGMRMLFGGERRSA